MCTSEPVFLESSAAACAAWRASSDPSVASRICVGNMLIEVTSYLYALFLSTMVPLVEASRISAHEPPRVCWRLQPLRGWSYDKFTQVPRADPEGGRPAGAGTPRRVRLGGGGDHVGCQQVRGGSADGPRLAPSCRC